MQVGGISPRVLEWLPARPERVSATPSEAAQTAELAKLKARDKEVRAHEAAHLRVGAGLVQGAASFTYQRGPDGQLYATGGEVSIDTSPGANAAETIQRAERIRAAALAPAQPSAQDYAVAAQAAQMARQARAEEARQAPPQDATAAPREAPGQALQAYAAAALNPRPNARLEQSA